LKNELFVVCYQFVKKDKTSFIYALGLYGGRLFRLNQCFLKHIIFFRALW